MNEIFQSLKALAKRSILPGAIMAGSGFIIGSGMFPETPSWAITLSNVALAAGVVVCVASVGFIVAAKARQRREATR
ncbi:hypothetical protein [Paraburkholderia phytofirmans]|uniref:hypothetical protein n=1 Tax=Paraburkholderia phytofirmans TaxID=261302 RepID=UPI0038B8F06C